MGVLNQVTMEQQRNEKWCWAAVTSSVFRALKQTPISQAQVVCQVLNNPNCRLEPTPDECNKVFLLDVALQEVCECNVNVVENTLDFADLQNQVDSQSRPVPITLRFNGGVFHYCLIKGCNDAGGLQEVILLDPAHLNGGETHIPYADLCDGAVLGGATWVQSFVIQ